MAVDHVTVILRVGITYLWLFPGIRVEPRYIVPNAFALGTFFVFGGVSAGDSLRDYQKEREE
jgi:hypothetical protein